MTYPFDILARRSRRRDLRVCAELNARADAARDTRDYATAADLYGRILAADPSNAEIHIQCGHMNKELGRLELAERHYRQALVFTPEDPDLHIQLGHFFKVAGREREAIAAYQMAEQLAPGWQEPIDELAALNAAPVSRSRLPQTASALPPQREPTRQQSKVGKFPTPKKRRRLARKLAALNMQADAARDARDFAKAADLYGAMLALDPYLAEIHVQCGHMNKEAGRLALAERHYLQAQTLMPDDADLHLQLGHFFKVAERKQEAVAAYQTALRLIPGWQAARDELEALGAAPALQVTYTPHSEAGYKSKPLYRTGRTLPSDPHLLFDEAFYLESRPDLLPGEDAWSHFIRRGATQRRDPHLLFSVDHYLTVHLDVAATGENPLLHFFRDGWREGRSFHWLFLPDEYRRIHPQIGSEEPLQHFLRRGLVENWQPHPLFSPSEYLSRYPHVASANMPAFAHFLKHGDAEGLSPHPLFDPAYYRKQAALPATKSGFQHYMRFGLRSSPHPLFSGEFYLRRHGGVAASRVHPLHHYVAFGAAEGLAPHTLFDPGYYLKQTGDAAAKANPLLHYLAIGAAQRLAPHPLFDPAYYQNHSARCWNGNLLPRTGPLISVLVPAYNTPPQILADCIESVRDQTYTNWELIVIDDCSSNHETVAELEKYHGFDERIKVLRTPRNLHIAGATNLAAEQARGDFIAFLDHDDRLEAHALAEVGLAVMSRADIDLLYTDEDKINQAGQHTEPYYKPDWSPDHLWSVMYVLHFLVIRKALFWRLGGLRAERAGAQDYDLALRASGQARHVHHIPRILYHWRMIPGSAAADVDAKPYALIAARQALEDAVNASGVVATVEDGLLPGTFRVRYSLAARPPVTLLVFTNDSERDVPGRGRINLVRHFLRSIAEKSTYANYRLLVVDNMNASLATRQLVAELGGEILSFQPEAQFNYARKANFATRHIASENVIYLNDDLEVITPDWIESLLELSQQPAIGGVGARLLYPNNTVQHSGMVLGIYDSAAHVFMNMSRNTIGYNGYTHLIRNYSAVTGAVFATRREVMNSVGGLDEKLRVDYNDIDLCLRIGQQGRRIVFTPYCELYHFEGSTQIRTTQAPDEVRLFRERWQDKMRLDPYYNPNLPRDRLNFV